MCESYTSGRSRRRALRVERGDIASSSFYHLHHLRRLRQHHRHPYSSAPLPSSLLSRAAAAIEAAPKNGDDSKDVVCEVGRCFWNIPAIIPL